MAELRGADTSAQSTKSQTDNTELRAKAIKFIKLVTDKNAREPLAYVNDLLALFTEHSKEQDIKSRIDEKQKLQIWLGEQDDNEALVRLAKDADVELDELFAKLRSLL